MKLFGGEREKDNRSINDPCIFYFLWKYEYPFQNPYMATILGSSTLMINGVSESFQLKYIRLNFLEV